MAKQHSTSPVHKPRAWLYLPAVWLCRIFTGLWYHLKITRSPAFRKAKGALIVIGNHVSYVDPLILATALGTRWRANIIAANDIMIKPVARFLLRKLGVIPTTQFVKCPGATRAMIRILKENGCVAYYPEAERSISGRAGHIDQSTAKFIKMMKKPVAFCQIDGAYLTWPRWAASQLYRGRCSASVDIIFTPTEIERLTLEEIHEKILGHFRTSDYLWQNTLPQTNAYRRGRCAEGLEKILFKCVNCGAEFSLSTMGSQLNCRACGKAHEIAASGFFAQAIALEKQLVAHPGDWYELQKSCLKSDLENPQNPRQYQFAGKIISQAAEQANQGASWEDEAKVEFVVDRFGVEVTFAEQDEPPRAFLFKDQSGLMLEHGLYVQFTTSRRNYRCYFDNPYAPSLVRIAWEISR